MMQRSLDMHTMASLTPVHISLYLSTDSESLVVFHVQTQSHKTTYKTLPFSRLS